MEDRLLSGTELTQSKIGQTYGTSNEANEQKLNMTVTDEAQVTTATPGKDLPTPTKAPDDTTKTTSSSDGGDGDVEKGVTPETMSADDQHDTWAQSLTFHGIREAQGFAAVTAARASVLISNIFLGTSLITLAAMSAGGLQNNTKYGFKPSSLLTILAVASGLVSAFCMPIVGAVIDLTPHRRQLGILSAVLITIIQSIQIGTVMNTWFVMAILQVVAGTLLDIEGILSHAYLPEMYELVNNENRMGNLVASFIMVTFSSQFILVIVIVGIQTIFSFNDILTAQMSQGINAVLISIFFYIGWISKLPDVPVLHARTRNNSNLVCAGFSQIWVTIKGINTHYHDTLRWFFLAVVFVNAGAKSLTIIAIAYMKDHMAMSGEAIGWNFFLVLLCGVPGAGFGTIPTRMYNPNVSLKLNLVVFALSCVSGGFILTGPERSEWMYIFSCIWGAILGWHYSVVTTFFSTCLPKGQQAELSGFLFYCKLIMSWLPPLIFTIMNEAGIEMNYGLMHLSIYFVAGFICLMFVAPWEKCQQQAREVSKNIHFE